MAQRTAVMRLESFRGGLNDTDPPHRIADDQLQTATEVVLSASGGVTRRGGNTRAFAPPSTTANFDLLVRHTPSQLLSATEVWAIPRAGTTFYRSTTGTTWTSVTVDQAENANGAITDAASFNGKLYLAYAKNAGTDRLHVWDGSAARLSGISTPSAPTVANTGAGALAATIRYYKVQFFYQDANSKFTLSDLSAAQSFTPSGTGTHARVTKPATVDSATGWRVWASSDNVSYYLIASQAVVSTTYDDNTAPASYATSNLGVSYVPADAGAYTPAWSAKYLLVDENRLLIAGAHETARYASRIGWSSILGTAAAAYGDPATTSDDERFPPDNYLDLDSDEGGELTGMESLSGSVYVFKKHAIYKLVRTGDASVPYKPVTITKTIGAISRRSIVPGEDEAGNPCLYFLSERGPYRLGNGGLQYLGRDIETVWATVTKRGYNFPPHGAYHATAGRLHFWVPVSNTAPSRRLTFHVKLGQTTRDGVRGGWTISAAQSAYAASSAMLPESLTNRDSELWPYTIQTYQAFYPAAVWKCDTSALTDDELHATTGAVTGTRDITPVARTKAFSLGLGAASGVTDAYVACQPSAGGTTLSVSLERDFLTETRTKTGTFTGTSTRLPQAIPDLTMAAAQYVAVSLTSSTQAAFTVDEIALRIRAEEPL